MQKTTSSPETQDPLIAAFGHLSVMIVDKDVQVVSVISALLDDYGFATQIAQNTTQLEPALSVIQPDLFVMDIDFDPSGSLVADLRRRGYLDCPIIILAPDDDTVSRLRAVRIGGDIFLTKPIGIMPLLLAINQALAGHQISPIKVLQIDCDRVDGSHASVEGDDLQVHAINRDDDVLQSMDRFQPDVIVLQVTDRLTDAEEITRLLDQTEDFAHLPVVMETRLVPNNAAWQALEQSSHLVFSQGDTQLPSRLAGLGRHSRAQSLRIGALMAGQGLGRSAFFTNREVILTVNRSGRIMHWSDAAIPVFGYSENEFSGLPITELVHPHQHAALTSLITDPTPPTSAVKEAEVPEYDCIRAEGGTFVAEMSIAHWQVFGEQFATIIIRDRSSSHHARQEIDRKIEERRAEIQLRDQAIDAASVAMVIVDAIDPDYPIQFVNRAFERMTGYAFDEAVGRNARFLQGSEPDQPEIGILRRAISDSRPARVTLRNYRRDGSMFWNEVQITPARFGESLSHYIGILRDVTAERIADAPDESVPSHPDADASMEAPATAEANFIMLVEDEALVRDTVRRVLTELGYSVIEMETGVDAVDYMRSGDRRDDIRLILSDIVMPGGVSGVDLADIASTEKPDIKILLTTGYMGDHLPKDLHYELLHKPFDMKTLSQKIESLLA